MCASHSCSKVKQMLSFFSNRGQGSGISADGARHWQVVFYHLARFLLRCTSMWHYKYYYVYGFLLLVFTILIIVRSYFVMLFTFPVCVTIVSIYLLLNNEDYRWPWMAFNAASSTGLYVLLYSVYYFIAKTEMSGILQTWFLSLLRYF